MKSFQFDTSAPQPEVFVHNICEFLFYIEKYSSSQIEQTLQKIAYSEKIKNKVLPNFKDIPDWSRLATKNPQTLAPNLELNLTPVEKIDNSIIQAIAKGHIALQEPEEKKKPTALRTTKPEVPAKPDPKSTAKTATNPGSAGLKKAPLAAGKASGVTPGLAGRNATSYSAQNKVMASKLKSQGSGKNLAAPKPNTTNSVPDSQEILKAKMEEVKEELKANDVIPKTSSDLPADDKNIDENRPKLARFSVQETEVVSKHHIVKYMEAKKGIKAQVAKLKGDITYYKEKENATKKKFISRLTSHLDSVQTIFQRDYQISLQEKEKSRRRNNEEDEEEEPPKIQFFALEMKDKKFPRIPLEIMKGLQVAQTILVNLKKKMTVANEDFRSIVEYSQVFQEEGAQMHPVDKFLRLFKSRFLNDAIQSEMQFLKKEVASYLEKPDIARVMMAAAEAWKTLNFFEPTEELQRNGIENNPQQQISWLKYTVNSDSNLTEISCSKTGFKPSKKAMAGWKDGAKVIEMEASSLQVNLLHLFLEYLSIKHPISQDKKGIENIRGVNFALLLKFMRMMSIITQGGCRNFPLFMVQANN